MKRDKNILKWEDANQPQDFDAQYSEIKTNERQVEIRK
jgi:hypothetical protein